MALEICKSFPHYKSMESICCHGSQSSNPISQKNLTQPFPISDDALHEI